MAGSASDKLPTRIELPEDWGKPKGVWVVWVSSVRSEGICGIWPEEVGALRFVNDSGYGKAEFVQFGELA